MCVCGGGGAQQLQCKSESAQRSEKQQSPCDGEGALNLKKMTAGKTIRFTPKKKLAIRPPVFCTFLIHPQPNNIVPARQQPRDWGSLLNFWSGTVIIVSFATTRLHGICNGSNNGMGGGGGGGAHSNPTAFGLEISAPSQNFRVLFESGRGHKSVLSSPTRLQEI